MTAAGDEKKICSYLVYMYGTGKHRRQHMDELNFTLEIMITILATIGTFTLAIVSYSGLRRSQHISRMLLEIEEVRNIP